MVVICPRCAQEAINAVGDRSQDENRRCQNPRCPVCSFANRGVHRIHISSGIAAIRVSVMELGRFTR